MIKPLKISLALGLAENLLVILAGFWFYLSTFRGGRLDICSGSGEEWFDLPAIGIGLLIGVPASLWGATKLSKSPRTAAIAIALLALLLNLTPYILWHLIDHLVFTSRGIALYTDCSE